MCADATYIKGHVEWPWSRSLGGTEPGDARAYVIRRILFGVVRDRCSALDLREGALLHCRRQTRDAVEVELASGAVRSLHRSYAWFVQVEPASMTDRPRPSISTDRDIDSSGGRRVRL